MAKINARARHQARCKLLQALYQWQVADCSLSEVKQYQLAQSHPKKVDIEYFTGSLQGIAEQLVTLDAAFEVHLDRNIDELDPITKSILRISTYELSHRIEIPYRVVLDEALEMAKTFGAQDCYKFINGVLDQLAARLRAQEVQARRGDEP